MSEKMRVAAVTGFAAICATSAFAVADPVTVPNNSFESYNADYYSSPTNWTTSYSLDPDYVGSSPGQDNPGTSTGVTGATGSRAGALYFDNNNGATQTGATYSNLFVMSNDASLGTFAANTTYTLNAAYGTSDNNNGGYSVGYGLYAAPLTLATVNAGDSTSTVSTNFAANQTVYAGPSVVIDTASDTSLVGEPIFVSLFVSSGYPYGRAAYFDNVALDATSDATPEPATISLGVIALGGLLLRRRKAAASTV